MLKCKPIPPLSSRHQEASRKKKGYTGTLAPVPILPRSPPQPLNSHLHVSKCSLGHSMQTHAPCICGSVRALMGQRRSETVTEKDPRQIVMIV